MNNRTFKEQAAAFADRLMKEAGNDPSEIVSLAWQYAYNRRIRSDEKGRMIEFLSSTSGETKESSDATRSAVEEMCLALFNTNEFIYMP